jgi:hypothetical protein
MFGQGVSFERLKKDNYVSVIARVSVGQTNVNLELATQRSA